MSVKIYDSTIGAFKDAETPLIWDEQAQAWRDSVGLVWNESAQAWEERWSADAEGVLYNKGNECTKITGGWISKIFINDYGSSAVGNTATKDKACLKVYSGSGKSIGFFTSQKIDTRGYSKLCINVTEIFAQSVSCIDLTLNNTSQILCDTRYRDDYGHRITTLGIVEWDISTYNDNYYFGFGCWAGDSICVDKVWLE